LRNSRLSEAEILSSAFRALYRSVTCRVGDLNIAQHPRLPYLSTSGENCPFFQFTLLILL